MRLEIKKKQKVSFAIFGISCVHGVGQSCQDIDHTACVDMATQNTNLCSDPILSTSACPRFCNSCPITCYNCNISTPDVTSCNTLTCGHNQACMTKEVKSMTGVMHSYTLACENKAVCNGNRKRSLKSRSVYIDCCTTDLCNRPHMPTTSIPTLKTTMIPKSTVPTILPTTAIPTTVLHTEASQSGQWSEWSSWGACILAKLEGIGYKNRTRVCTKPGQASCSNGSPLELQQCTDKCTPAQIVDIKVMGKWELNGTVLLQCVTNGNPKPTVRWLPHLAKSDLSIQLFEGDPSTVLVGPVKQKPAGWYTCEAVNYCGTMTTKNYYAPSFVTY